LGDGRILHFIMKIFKLKIFPLVLMFITILIHSCGQVDEVMVVNKRVMPLEINDFSIYLDIVLKLTITTLVLAIIIGFVPSFFFGMSGGFAVGWNLGLLFNFYWLIESRDYGFFWVLFVLFGAAVLSKIVQVVINWLFLKYMLLFIESRPEVEKNEFTQLNENETVSRSIFSNLPILRKLESNRRQKESKLKLKEMVNEINQRHKQWKENTKSHEYIRNLVNDPSNDKYRKKAIEEMTSKLSYAIKSKNDITKTNTTYPEILIGNQVWMSRNLNIDKFRNGDIIPLAKTEEEWKKANELCEPACCYYDYLNENRLKFGILYNWYAIEDSRGLAPEGWKIPTDEDWSCMVNYFGGKTLATRSLKNKHLWDEYEGKSRNGTNVSGFSALPCGYCGPDGYFQSLGKSGYFWTSTEDLLQIQNAEFGSVYWEISLFAIPRCSPKGFGYSVRCLKIK